jgi:hypothetical protein
LIYAVLIRRLRPGTAFEEFREAWLPDETFAIPVTVATARRLDDPRELLSLGRADVAAADVPAFLEHIAASEARRHDRIADVIEATVHTGIYEVVTEDDLGPGGVTR